MSTAEQPSPPTRSPVSDSKKEDMESFGKYGVMYSPEYEWGPVMCTRKAYGPALKRSLFFHTKFVDRETALNCIDAMPETYNGFSRRGVKEAVESMPDNIRVSVAREHSPCLYIWTDDPDAVENALDSIRPNNDEMRRAVKDNHSVPTPPKELGRVSEFPSDRVRDDEGEKGFNGWYLVRAWWD